MDIIDANERMSFYTPQTCRVTRISRYALAHARLSPLAPSGNAVKHFRMPTLSAQCFEVSIKAVPHLALCRVGKMSAVTVEKTREFLCKNASQRCPSGARGDMN
jgi:hypothetical protein